MQAIETIFDGYRFRSRLEARWAVFFKTLGVKYEYEKEGYDLDGVWYLPDFWLPEQECWIEIKGGRPTAIECEKALRLAQVTKHRVYVFEGNFEIPDADGGIYPIAANVYFPSHTSAEHGGMSPVFSWCHCSGCGKWIIKSNVQAYDNRFYYSSPGIIQTSCPLLEEVIAAYQKAISISERKEIKPIGYLWFEPLALIAAYTAARQARFEHGR